MKWRRGLKQYIRENWQLWIISVVVGITAALIARFFPGISRFYVILAFDDWLILTWSGLIIALVLLWGWPRSVDFWRRLRRTLSMERPALLYIDVIIISCTCFALTIWTFIHRSPSSYSLSSHAILSEEGGPSHL